MKINPCEVGCACTMLADIYYNWRGVKKDVRTAIIYFSRYSHEPGAQQWYKRLSSKAALPAEEIGQASRWMCQSQQRRNSEKIYLLDTMNAR